MVIAALAVIIDKSAVGPAILNLKFHIRNNFQLAKLM